MTETDTPTPTEQATGVVTPYGTVPPYGVDAPSFSRFFILTEETIDEAIAVLGLRDVTIERNYERDEITEISGHRSDEPTRSGRHILHLGDVIRIFLPTGRASVLKRGDLGCLTERDAFMHVDDLHQALVRVIQRWAETTGIEIVAPGPGFDDPLGRIQLVAKIPGDRLVTVMVNPEPEPES